MRISAGERVWAFFGYLAILCLIPIWFKKDSIFVQFHARQGLVLFLLWFVTSLIWIVLLVFIQQGLVQQILMFLLFLTLAVYALMALIGLAKVLIGERFRMPVVADVALRMGL